MQSAAGRHVRLLRRLRQPESTLQPPGRHFLELYCKQAAKKSDKEDDDAAAGAAQTAETEPEPDCEVNPNPQPRAKDSGPVDSVDDPSEALRARGFAQASSRVANG